MGTASHTPFLPTTIGGHVIKIVLDARGQISSSTSQVIELQYPPAYVLVRMIRTKAEALNGLESGVLPIIPLSKNFSIVRADGVKVMVTRQQLPITPAYAFTDYCAQAQRIDHCIVELATLPSGQLCLLMHMLHYLEVVAG